jgi:serine/threonine protein kinase
MSPVADCNLAEYFINVASSDDKLSLLRSYYGCLSNALRFLHNAKIRHRDIKPENILIKGATVLLIDFGLSFDWEHLSRSTTTADLAKTPVYAAPEVAFFEKRKNSASDVWSLGCVFLEIATVLKGETVSAMRDYFKLQNDNYRYYDSIEATKGWTRKLMTIGLEFDAIPIQWVAQMLRLNSDKRPTAAEVFDEIVNCEDSDKFCSPCCHTRDDIDDTDDVDGYDPLVDTV